MKTDPTKYSRAKLKAVLKVRNGYCISDYYEFNSPKLVFRCEKGHNFKAFPQDIIDGSWCLYCETKEERQERIAKRIKHIEELIGGKCLTWPVNNLSQELEWICRNRHKWIAAPAALHVKNPCKYCVESANQKRIKKIVEKKKGKLLTDFVRESNAKIKLECVNGHTWETNPYIILEGGWCPTCAKVEQRRKKKKNN